MNIESIKNILQRLSERKLLEHTIITHEVVIENDDLIGKTDICLVTTQGTLHNEEIEAYLQEEG